MFTLALSTPIRRESEQSSEPLNRSVVGAICAPIVLENAYANNLMAFGSSFEHRAYSVASGRSLSTAAPRA